MEEVERRQTRRVDCYTLKRKDGGFVPIWSFANVSDDSIPCLIINISQSGFSLLINKRYPHLPPRAELTIRDQTNKPLMSLRASLTVKWEREDFSVDSRLIGVLLQPDTLADINSLKSLLSRAETDGFEYLRCTALPLPEDSD